MTDVRQFAKNLNDFLEYKKEEGFQTLEISPETLAALKPTPAQKPTASTEGSSTEGSVRYFNTPNKKYENIGLTPSSSQSSVCVTGKTLEEIAGQIRVCTACPLSGSRQNTVPGEGNPNHPDIMFVGEGPGADEDAQGRPFVGAAGQLLNKMIEAMGYNREEVFIANIVKCRPPGNRVPLPEEMNACVPYLKAQIALIRPKIIVALGKTAVQ